MPRMCTICRHVKKRQIDIALLSGEPVRIIGIRHGLSHTSLLRHRFHCLPRNLVEARQNQIVADADFVLAKVSKLVRATENVLDRGERSGDVRIILAAVRELRPTLELLSRIAGQLKPPAETAAILTADHDAVRQIILGALEAFPEARVAVSAALLESPEPKE